MHNLDSALNNWMLAAFLLSIASFLVGLWIAYLVIKAGVRDGMLEAMRQQRPGRPTSNLTPSATDDFRATR